MYNQRLTDIQINIKTLFSITFKTLSEQVFIPLKYFPKQ